MNMEKPKNEMRLEKTPEGASDIELAMFLIKHIDNPCQVEVEPGRIENIREFYIRAAERALDEMTNPEAKKLLEFKIREYKKWQKN